MCQAQICLREVSPFPDLHNHLRLSVWSLKKTSVQPSDRWLAHQPWCGPTAVSTRLFPTPKESVIIAAIFKDAEITGAPVTKSEWNFSTTFYFLPRGWPGFIVDKIEPPQNSPLISLHRAEEPPATHPPPMAELRVTSDPSKELEPASAERQFPPLV